MPGTRVSNAALDRLDPLLDRARRHLAAEGPFEVRAAAQAIADYYRAALDALAGEAGIGAASIGDLAQKFRFLRTYLPELARWEPSVDEVASLRHRVAHGPVEDPDRQMVRRAVDGAEGFRDAVAREANRWRGTSPEDRLARLLRIYAQDIRTTERILARPEKPLTEEEAWWPGRLAHHKATLEAACRVAGALRPGSREAKLGLLLLLEDVTTELGVQGFDLWVEHCPSEVEESYRKPKKLF